MTFSWWTEPWIISKHPCLSLVMLILKSLMSKNSFTSLLSVSVCHCGHVHFPEMATVSPIPLALVTARPRRCSSGVVGAASTGSFVVLCGTSDARWWKSRLFRLLLGANAWDSAASPWEGPRRLTWRDPMENHVRRSGQQSRPSQACRGASMIQAPSCRVTPSLKVTPNLQIFLAEAPNISEQRQTTPLYLVRVPECGW